MCRWGRKVGETDVGGDDDDGDDDVDVDVDLEKMV